MFFFDTRTAAERRVDQRFEELAKEAKAMEPEPWSDGIKFKNCMRIKSDTYDQKSLFNVSDSESYETDINYASADKIAVSPYGDWVYRERLMNKNTPLQIYSGNRKGVIVFDGTVKIPMLHERRDDDNGWQKTPIMSFTPMEYFTLRPGIKMAQGHTLIAGLGMGYMLERVAAKTNVNKITLVEKSKDLIDWILPRLNLYGVDLDIVIDDAYSAVPKIVCDISLIDIFRGYGGNMERWYSRAGFESKSKKIWIWGSK